MQPVFESRDQRGIIAIRLGLGGLEMGEDRFDAIHCAEDITDDGRLHREPRRTQCIEYVLGRVGHPLETTQADEAAGALDGVDGPEDAIQQRGIFRVLLERYEIVVELGEIFVAFGEKIPKQVVHVCLTQT
jgi:hypothetical protein